MNRRQFLTLAGSIFGMYCLNGRAGTGSNNTPLSRTGLVYDDLFLQHWLEPGHPESPERLRAIHAALQSEHLTGTTRPIAITSDPEAWLHTIHTAAHLESIRTHYPQGDKVSRQVVAGVLDAVQAVCSGEIKNAFCATRPPGHHAQNTGRVEGFCFFNSIAIAARYAQKTFGFEKILIVDWDYHHGNGTEAAFYEDPSVLFFSTHDWRAYPGTGDPARTGSGAGEGFNINVHLPCGTTDRVIKEAFIEKLLPAAESFKPDLILISAGFDSRRGDLLGCYDVSDEGFVELTRIVMQLAGKYCDGRIVSILEGGYTPSGLASATVAHVGALMSGTK